MICCLIVWNINISTHQGLQNGVSKIEFNRIFLHSDRHTVKAGDYHCADIICSLTLQHEAYNFLTDKRIRGQIFEQLAHTKLQR